MLSILYLHYLQHTHKKREAKFKQNINLVCPNSLPRKKYNTVSTPATFWQIFFHHKIFIIRIFLYKLIKRVFIIKYNFFLLQKKRKKGELNSIMSCRLLLKTLNWLWEVGFSDSDLSGRNS